MFDLAEDPNITGTGGRNRCKGKVDARERFVAVFEIPPVESPETVVKVAIAAEVRRKK